MSSVRRAYVRTASGEWHYREAGCGDPLILLHHAGASAAEFSAVIPHLWGRYRVLAIDLPGHGASDSLPKPPLMRDYVQILEEIMDALEMPRAHLGGVHTGAEICLKTAVLHPSRARSLALYGVLCRDQKSLDALLPKEVLTLASIAEDGSHLFNAWKFQSGFVRSGTSPDVIHSLVTESLNAWHHDTLAHRACYVQNGEARSDMPKVTCPTLMLSGELDPLGPDAIAASRIIPGCRLVTIPGADVHVARHCAAAYAKILAEFLGQL